MFDFLRRKTRSSGSVLFRGSIPVPLDNFAFLEAVGVELEPRAPDPGFLWSARARHPQWGEADLHCLRSSPPPPRELLELDRRLIGNEVDLIADCGSSVLVQMTHERRNVLRERKLALRMMHAILGRDGIAVADHASERFWSRVALEEELLTDADLDIDSIHTLHAVYPDRGRPDEVVWLHSHGLADLGHFDFDILEPAAEVTSAGIPRAIAFAILEGMVERDGAAVSLAEPGGVFRMVPVDLFERRADARFRALREDPEGSHATSRSVVCEPKRGFLSKLLGGRVEPSRWLREPIDDNTILFYSNAATELMAGRARDTYPQLRSYCEELERFQVKALVKLGVPVDHSDGGREHLWFEATSISDDSLSGILLNQPWYISGMEPGKEYSYGVEMLSDWTIFTPAGTIRPHEGTAVRLLRINGEAILDAMRGRDDRAES